MANLFNNDIGLNYKGLINIGATINQNISGSLQYLTDGDGNNLPIQVSTSAVRFGGSTGLNWNDTNNRLGIGTDTPLGILHLKTTAATIRLLLDGDAAQSKIITYRTNGLQRFGLYTNATAESGANAGSDFALRAYNDAGSLLSTPLFIKRSTGHVGINQTAPTASLQVRGDGTNPIFRVENSDGVYRQIVFPGQQVFNTTNGGIFSIRPNEGTTNNPGFDFVTFTFGSGAPIMRICSRYTIGASTNNAQTGLVFANLDNITVANFRNNFLATGFSITNTTGTSGGISYVDTFAAAAGSGSYRPLSIAYTINNTGAQTGNTTGIFLNATLTNLNGMTHNLMDLQVGGVSAFKVQNAPLGIGIQTSGSWIAYNNSVVQLSGIQAGFFYVLNSTSFFQINLTSGETRNFGNLFLGSVGVVTSARLHVRGDGTNPIARFENNAGTAAYVINAAGNAHTFTGSVDVSDVVNVAATRGYFWTNRGGIATSGDGIILFRNNNNTDFNRLQFGGTTTSFPSLKRSTTTIQSRLADDSDFTFIQGKLQTENDFVSESIISASGYIVLYDRNGTAYKVLATAL